MNKIIEKINEISNDVIFIEKIDFIIRALDHLAIPYSVFGSCAFQSYFPIFFRLPNDLDIIIRYEDFESFKRFCNNEGFIIIEKHKRLKIYMQKFCINVVPEYLDVITEQTSSICGTIDLANFRDDSSKRKLNLLNSRSDSEIYVLSLEGCLFLELFRAVYTNSLFTIIYVFSVNSLNVAKFNDILSKNDSFAELIRSRLTEYIEKISHFSHFSELQVKMAVAELSKLSNSIHF